MSTSIKVAGVEIRCDHEGRYCVNDLHRASGGSKKHQPSNWLALQQTQALIGAIERAAQEPGAKETCEPVMSRQGIGTFTTKSLVYSYAMWISPEFHLRVIQAYDQMQMQALSQRQALSPALPDFTDPIQAARAWADEAERVRELASLAKAQGEHLQAARPALEFVAAVASSEDTITLGQFAKLMNIGEVRLFNLLRSEKVLITGGARHNLPFQRHIDLGRFKVNERTYTDPNTGRTHLSFQTRLTPKGQMWLQREYFPQVQIDQSANLDLFGPAQLDMSTPRQERLGGGPAPMNEVGEHTATPQSVVKAEIARLRELRDLMRQGAGRLTHQPGASDAPPVARPMRLAAPEHSDRVDPFGDLTHPEQEREARIRHGHK